MFKRLRYLLPLGIPLCAAILLPNQQHARSVTAQQEEAQTAKKEAKALIIGSSGSGKAYIGNIIFSKQVFLDSYSNENRTKKNEAKTEDVEFENETYKLTLVDTVGFFDPDKSCLDLVDDTIKLMRDLQSLNKIILVVSYGERMDTRITMLLQALSKCLFLKASDLLLVINKTEVGTKYDFELKKQVEIDDATQINIKHTTQQIQQAVEISQLDTMQIKKFHADTPNYNMMREQISKDILFKILNNNKKDTSSLLDWRLTYQGYKEKTLEYYLIQKKDLEKSVEHASQKMKDVLKGFTATGAAVGSIIGYFSGDITLKVGGGIGGAVAQVLGRLYQAYYLNYNEDVQKLELCNQKIEQYSDPSYIPIGNEDMSQMDKLNEFLKNN